jgi:hypothetical protein
MATQKRDLDVIFFSSEVTDLSDWNPGIVRVPWDAAPKLLSCLALTLSRYFKTGVVGQFENKCPTNFSLSPGFDKPSLSDINDEVQKLSTDGCPIWAISIVIRMQLRQFTSTEVEKRMRRL